MIGEITSYIVHPDGREELVEEGRNLIVNSAYVAIAMMMKESDTALGYWALGDGDTEDSDAWNAGVAAGTTAAAATDVALRQEVFRKAITPADIEYIDSVGTVSATPTNRLQITVWFEENEPSDSTNVFLREWGIFGGDATAAADSGLMFNHKVHSTYEKTPFVRLKRVLKLTL